MLLVERLLGAACESKIDAVRVFALGVKPEYRAMEGMGGEIKRRHRVYERLL